MGRKFTVMDVFNVIYGRKVNLCGGKRSLLSTRITTLCLYISTYPFEHTGNIDN